MVAWTVVGTHRTFVGDSGRSVGSDRATLVQRHSTTKEKVSARQVNLVEGALRPGEHSGSSDRFVGVAAFAASFAAPMVNGAMTALKSKSGATPDSILAAWLPRISLFVMAVFCSTNFTFIKLLEDGHSNECVAAVRFGVALLPFLPLIPQHLNWTSIASGVEIGLWCTLAYVSQAIGLPYTEASTGAFITSLAMVVVPAFKLISGGKVEPQTWLSVVFALIGTALLVGLGGNGLSSLNVGDALCGVTAVGFGLMFARMDHHSKAPDFDPVGCTVWQVVTLAASMACWLLATHDPANALQDVASLLSGGPEVLAIVMWVGLVTTAAVLYVETVAMEKIDGTEAGIIFASEPVWATIFASLMLGESFGAQEGAGAFCILIACLLTQVRLDTFSQKS